MQEEIQKLIEQLRNTLGDARADHMLELINVMDDVDLKDMHGKLVILRDEKVKYGKELLEKISMLKGIKAAYEQKQVKLERQNLEEADQAKVDEAADSLLENL